MKAIGNDELCNRAGAGNDDGLFFYTFIDIVFIDDDAQLKQA